MQTLRKGVHFVTAVPDAAGRRMTNGLDHEDVLRQLGQRIAEMRRARGLTQEQLAALAGIDVQAIQRAKTARTALALGRLAKVARGLGVGLADLFSFDGGVDGVDAHEAEAEVHVLAAYRSIPEDRRAWVVGILEAIARSQP